MTVKNNKLTKARAAENLSDSNNNLEELEAFIRAGDDVVLPEDGHYYEKLHDKIMAKVANDGKPEEKQKSRRTRAATTLFKSALVTLAHMML